MTPISDHYGLESGLYHPSISNMVNIPTTVHLQSSIPSPTGLSRRDTGYYENAIPHQFNTRQDPLDGSLGPFLVSCAVVFVVILGICSVLWGVHRRTILHAQRLHSPVTVEKDGTTCPSPCDLSTDLKPPPNRLRIRSPIQRLRLLRSSSQNGSASTIPIWTSSSGPSATGLIPDIVVSRASPIFPVSPSLTTSSAPSISSFGSLEVPGTVRAPLVQCHPPPRQSIFNRQPQKLQAKISSPTKGGRLPLGHGKKSKKSSVDKENQVPQVDAKPKRTKEVFGSRSVPTLSRFRN